MPQGIPYRKEGGRERERERESVCVYVLAQLKRLDEGN